uniref:Putative secreted protein n=1 Tax=Ixodes ricinus TaxID=34613 RepID=A0A147BE65_IXORI
MASTALTFGVFCLPSLHGQLVLLKLVAPVRVNLAVVRLGRRPAGVGVHGDIVAAQRPEGVQVQVVASGVSLRQPQHHQPVSRRVDKLVPLARHRAPLPPLLVVPDRGRPHRTRVAPERSRVGWLQELGVVALTAQVDALAPVGAQLATTDAAFAKPRRGITDILKVPVDVGAALVVLPVPAAVGVPHAAQAAQVAPPAQVQAHLTHSVVRAHVERLVLVGDLHGTDRFPGIDLEHVHEVGERLAGTVLPLHQLVDQAVPGAGVVDEVVHAVHVNPVHGQREEHDVLAEEDGAPSGLGHGRVHEGVGAQEVEHRVGQGLGAVHAQAWAGLGHLARQHGEPGRRGRLLLLELAPEGALDVAQPERADGRAVRAAVQRCGEDRIDVAVVVWKLVHRLDFVEIKGVLSG